ncbi:MAG: GmrSD restriction endonuclease domain-containing protein [Rhabdochlamydiaceae bacterium]
MSEFTNEDVQKIIDAFRDWLKGEAAQKHLKTIEKEKQEVKDLMKKLDSMDKTSIEFTYWVLYGLLPYSKTKYAKRVSTFPVFMNIKLFLKNYNYSDEDWNKIANMIYTLAKNFQQHPENLDKWIKEFVSDKVYTRMIQCGSITPIIFCINDSFPLVNNRVRHTYNEFSTIFGWNDTISQKLEHYLDNVEKVKKFIAKLNIHELQNLAVFDVFCYWYDYFYKATNSSDEEETESEYDEKIKIVEIDPQIFVQSVQIDDVAKFEPHSLRNPERIKINQIISNSSKGKWALPNFQRYFDWKRNDVKEFLQSIFNDYYVGALLLWDVGKEPQLDIIPIKGVDIKKDEIRPDSIILDGQQRITSLYYALRSPNFSLRGSNMPVYFYINFFEFFNPNDSSEIIETLSRKIGREESFKKMLFPFYELERYSEWVDEFEDFLLKSSTDQDKIRSIRRIIDKKLRHIIDGFEIPYISLPDTIELPQVTDIFEKINTMGKVLSVFDLLIARLSKYQIELKKLWEESIKRYPKLLEYYKSIDKIPIYILQAISLCYNKTSSCKREDILNIYQNVFEPTDMPFEEIWYEMAEYTNKALTKIENLRDGFGVKDKNELPFAPMIPILASLTKEIESRSNKADCYKKLGVWYWSSVFSNAYSGAVDSQLTTDFKEMKEWFSDDSKTPKTIDRARREFIALSLREVQSKSNAMYKGVMSLLALEGSNDFNTNQTLENARNNDKDHLFPKAEFHSLRNVNSILNISWMSDETNRKIKRYKKPSVYVKEFIKEKYNGNEKEFLKVLESHFVNKDAYNLMLLDNFQDFISEREKTILDKIKGMIGLEEPIQKNTMITPEQPFSNRVAFWNAIKSCDNHIYWVDKYFSKEGLELLSQSLDTNKIKIVKIIVSIEKADEKLRSLFKDFREEMKNKGVVCELRVIIDPKLKSSMHDRWMLSKNICFNIPSPDTVARGQYSEIKITENRPPFDEWWSKTLDIVDNWNEIQKNRIK